MSKAVVVFALATCIAAPASMAQHRDPSAPQPVIAAAAPAAIQDDAATAVATGKPRSGFGQVMRMLTDLLQEAARKQASATGNDASLSATAGNSAVNISVTPVAGRSGFYAPKSRSGKVVPPVSSAAAMHSDAPSRGEPELAVQAGGSN